jgi:hypothetical protein
MSEALLCVVLLGSYLLTARLICTNPLEYGDHDPNDWP